MVDMRDLEIDLAEKDWLAEVEILSYSCPNICSQFTLARAAGKDEQCVRNLTSLDLCHKSCQLYTRMSQVVLSRSDDVHSGRKTAFQKPELILGDGEVINIMRAYLCYPTWNHRCSCMTLPTI